MDKSLLIVDKISEIFNINVKFVTDDDITLYIFDLQVTLDHDIQYVRIHKNWLLIKAIDLEYCDVDESTSIIVNQIKNIQE